MRIPRIFAIAVLCAAAAAQEVPPMPDAVPLPTPKVQFTNNNGAPCANCKVWSYAAGTTTLQDTYTSSTAGTKNKNPIELDPFGRADIWIGGLAYKFVLERPPFTPGPHGTVIWTVDNVSDTTFYYIEHLKFVSDSQLLSWKATGSPAGGATRVLRDKVSDVLSVKDFGAVGTGATSPVQGWCTNHGGTRYTAANDSACLTAIQGDYSFITSIAQEMDFAAFQAGINAACTATSGRHLTIPPATGYYIDTTVSLGCGNLLIKGVGRLARINYTGSGAAFTTNGNSYTTFEDLFLVGTGNVVDQVGIYADGVTAATTHTSIRNSFIAQFGTKPPLAVTGAAIKVRGDNLSLEVARNTFEVWGNGLDIDGTVDLMRVHDNEFGVSTGYDSGWGIILTNSAGSGQNWIEHNNLVTPGGGVKVGPSAGLVHFTNNQYEALVGNPDVSNAEAAAFEFRSAINYVMRDNNVTLHSKGDYCYWLADYSGGTWENNKCGDPVLNSWGLASASTALGLTLSKNNDFTNVPDYSIPDYRGIVQTDSFNGYRSWGTQYPLGPAHFHLPNVPYSTSTTLAVAIVDPAATTMTVTDGTNITLGAVLWIDGEQVRITDASASPVFSIARGYNGTTAAVHALAAVVSFGCGANLLLTTPSSYAADMCMGFGLHPGSAYLKIRQRSGNLFVPQPLKLDGLWVESTDATLANTQQTIKMTSTQADYPWRLLDSTGARKVSITNTGSTLLIENSASTRFGGVTTGGITTFFGGVDASTEGLAGTFSAHPLKFYTNSVVRAWLPTDGGLTLTSAAPPCNAAHEGNLYYTSGTPSTVKMCMLSSTSTYVIVTLATAP